MFKRKTIYAVVAAASVLTACGGSGEGDNITITVDNSVVNNAPAETTTNTPAAGCENAVTESFVSYNSDCSVGTLAGVIDKDFILTNDIEWRLDGEVVVGNGNLEVTSDADVQAVRDAGLVLTIEAGSNIKAFDDGSLIVTRGSKLMAEGTASQPITFSSLDSDFKGYGEWGGVIVQGFAPQYGQGGTGACYGTGTVCNVEGEGGTIVGRFGGNDVADNSGVIKYVRIAEGGKVAGPNNEINGLTLQGVGYGTTVEYVQVHGNLDDGIEWFGGTVNAKYLVLTNNDDDDIDFDEGYQGNIQYALVQKDPNKLAPTGSNDPRGIEANSSDEEYVPETAAVLANITLVGSPVTNSDAGAQPGMRLRGAVNVDIYNTSVDGFDYGCMRIDSADTDGTGANVLPSVVNLQNILNNCDGGIYPKKSPTSESNVTSVGLSYSATYAIEQSEAKLAAAPTITSVNNGSGFVFDQTNFVGAVDPAAASAWWEGWTIPGSLDGADPDTSPDFVSCDSNLTACTLSGTIDRDYTLVSGVEWRLDGEVIVGAGNLAVASDAEVQAVKDAGVVLTIKPGVHVRAFDDGSLIVTRGSRLEAAGTAASPITFSSLGDDDFDGLGEWGGVILQGFAPQYGQGGTGVCYGTGTVCNVEGEGGTIVGRFGGNDPADNSGTLKYVRIAEGGKIAGPNNEINGLTLQGVGHGTTLDYIQVHNNLDDGIEWFGGNVNATHLVLTGNDDDDIDFDEGYKGNIQYAIIKKSDNAAPQGSNDPRGIEANSSDEDFVPETEATLANILVLGGNVNNAAGAQQPGMRLRGALTVSIYNTAVRDFDTGCIRIDDADTNGDGTADTLSDVTLVNVLGECADSYYDKRAADVETNAGVAGTVTVDAAYALTDAQATVAETDAAETDNGSGFTFDNTTFVGAVEPGTDAADAWWAGWIIDGSL